MRSVAYQFGRCEGGGSRCRGFGLEEQERREERWEDGEVDIFEHISGRREGACKPLDHALYIVHCRLTISFSSSLKCLPACQLMKRF